ncbi:hypothetical protein JYU34_005620 [Plutella xylostella]|uniref:Uncharacterized protein n=1 Tax=Plutella xylostella TaxID=51655 RepID=A0ABQ7QTP8_PLUXY|nr:hypothetical protein JYU34_005620 [Plutella xylostella]
MRSSIVAMVTLCVVLGAHCAPISDSESDKQFTLGENKSVEILTLGGNSGVHVETRTTVENLVIRIRRHILDVPKCASEKEINAITKKCQDIDYDKHYEELEGEDDETI